MFQCVIVGQPLSTLAVHHVIMSVWKVIILGNVVVYPRRADVAFFTSRRHVAGDVRKYMGMNLYLEIHSFKRDSITYCK